jgi:general secretion pathway protein G
MRRQRRQNGFTLVEVIVVAAIISILAGILVPLIFKEIDEARISRAYADIRSISSAMLVFKKDTSQWPINANCTNTITMLTGNGNIPPTITGTGWDTSTRTMFDYYLNTDDNACWSPPTMTPAKWKGPYMTSISPDPWGNFYLVNTPAMLATSGPIWIISAGPNGNLETNADSATLVGDDVGIRLR